MLCYNNIISLLYKQRFHYYYNYSQTKSEETFVRYYSLHRRQKMLTGMQEGAWQLVFNSASRFSERMALVMIIFKSVVPPSTTHNFTLRPVLIYLFKLFARKAMFFVRPAVQDSCSQQWRPTLCIHCCVSLLQMITLRCNTEHLLIYPPVMFKGHPCIAINFDCVHLR